MITGITQITRHVRDADEALAFYRDVLGSEIRMDQSFAPGQRWLTVAAPGGPEVELVLFDPNGWLEGERLEEALAVIGRQPQLILSTDDIHALHAHLKAAGVRLDTPEVRDAPWGRDLVFRDFYGDSINAVQAA